MSDFNFIKCENVSFKLKPNESKMKINLLKIVNINN